MAGATGGIAGSDASCGKVTKNFVHVVTTGGSILIYELASNTGCWMTFYLSMNLIAEELATNCEVVPNLARSTSEASDGDV